MKGSWLDIIMAQPRDKMQTMRGKGMDDLRRLVVQAMDDYKKEVDKQFDKHERRMDKQDDRMDGMDRTQTIQGEQIKNIEKTLDAIQDDTKWTRRTITGGVISTLIGGTGTAIYFVIKLGGG